MGASPKRLTGAVVASGTAVAALLAAVVAVGAVVASGAGVAVGCAQAAATVAAVARVDMRTNSLRESLSIVLLSKNDFLAYKTKTNFSAKKPRIELV